MRRGLGCPSSRSAGVFESVFFRGFVQNRLEAQVGHAWGIGGAAALYGLYHVGYGMGLEEILFLGGLGVIYAIALSHGMSMQHNVKLDDTAQALLALGGHATQTMV